MKDQTQDHEEEEEDDEEDNIPLAEILRRAQNAGVEFDATFEEYISVDNDAATTASFTEEDIIQSIQEKFGDDEVEGSRGKHILKEVVQSFLVWYFSARI